MNQEDQGKKMSQLIAKCWADEGFKQKLLAEPEATLKAAGVELPAGRSIKALSDDDHVFHLVIPAKPANPNPNPALSDQELDEELDKVVGAGWRVAAYNALYTVSVTTGKK